EESDHPTGWDDLLNRQGRMRWRDLRPRLPGTTGVSVLTWARGNGTGQPAPLPAGTIRAALTSARTGNELVVADLPRSFDPATRVLDRKSTRLNSSHVSISYAVFCLKKKTIKIGDRKHRKS